MRNESLCLVGGTFLGLIHICIASAAATRQRGTQWNLSSRGATEAPLEGAAGRLARARDNFKETFPLYLASFVLVGLNGKFGMISTWGSMIYLGARIVYLPLYAFDIIYVRTLVWMVSVGGILLTLAQLIL